VRSAARQYWPRHGLFTDGSSLDTVTLAQPGVSWAAEIDMAADSPALEAGAVIAQRTISEEFTALDPSAADGSENARAILVYAHPGGAGPAVVATANIKLAERAARFPTGISAEDKQSAIDALAEHGITITDDESG
jgi:hypothetical protein